MLVYLGSQYVKLPLICTIICLDKRTGPTHPQYSKEKTGGDKQVWRRDYIWVARQRANRPDLMIANVLPMPEIRRRL